MSCADGRGIVGRRKDLTDAERDLSKAIKRLKDEQGHVARRNARRAVRQALSAVKRCVERDYPSTTPHKERSLAKTPAERQRRFRARMQKQNRTGDWIPGGVYRELLIRAGVAPMKDHLAHEYWPLWCQALREIAVADKSGSKVSGLSIAKLKAIKRSPTERQIILSRWRLGDDAGTVKQW